MKQKIYPINDNFRAKSDPHSIILERKNTKGTWGDVTYHPNLKSLLAAVYEIEAREFLDNLNHMIQLKAELIKSIENFSDLPNFRK